MDGREAGLFAPEAYITRAEAATIFYRCLSEESRTGLEAEGEFYDVRPFSWYYEPVTCLAGAGALNGRSENYFAPDESITRAEFVTLALRFVSVAEYTGPDLMNDTAYHWAREEINKAVRNGMVNGYEDGSFRPDANITRAEAAAIMNRLLGRTAEGAFIPETSPWSDVSITAWYYTDVILASIP